MKFCRSYFLVTYFNRVKNGIYYIIINKIIMATASFSFESLLTPLSLKDFLAGEDQLNAIHHRQGHLLQHRWTVQQNTCLCYLFHWFSSCFLELVSRSLQCFCLTSLSRKVWVLSKQEQHRAEILTTQKVFGKRLLSAVMNTHSYDTQDFFLLNPRNTHLSEVSNNRAPLNFFHRNGICRGICLWFIYLYLKTSTSFEDPVEHMRALGAEFEHGAPRQAAFLHAIHWQKAYELLKFDYKKDHAQFNLLTHTPEQIIRFLQSFDAGLYTITLNDHCMTYLKTDESQEFLLDPIQGIFNIDSDVIFLKAMTPYFKAHETTRPILVDRTTKIIQ